MLKQRFSYSEEKTALQALIGLFPLKLAKVLLKRSGISEDKAAHTCSEEELAKLLEQILAFTCDIIGSGSFEQSQVTSGGVVLEEISADTLESKLHPGLFFAGEIMDVDGMCGGYNLQWAWSSGYVAGKAAAKAATEH